MDGGLILAYFIEAQEFGRLPAVSPERTCGTGTDGAAGAAAGETNEIQRRISGGRGILAR